MDEMGFLWLGDYVAGRLTKRELRELRCWLDEEEGRAEEAGRLLGRPFSIAGTIAHGKGLGSRIGRPTLNLLPGGDQLIPARGVYVAAAELAGRRFPAVTNVGVRPTVDRDGGVTVESHLLDQSVQLYGKGCRVDFLRRLRPEQKFESMDALRRQIARDADSARSYLAAQEGAAL